MDYTKLFYWLTVADHARTFFSVFAIFFTAVFLITQIVRIFVSIEGDGEEKFYTKVNKWTWYSTPFMLVFLSLWIFTPNKRDALLIVAGGTTLNFLANDKNAKQIPHELSGFLLTEIKNLAKDAEVDLNIADQKDKILEKAKKMSVEELMSEMKKDTTFAKIILEK